MNNLPINKYEYKLMLLLGLRGYKDGIKFRTDLDKNRYVTFNYFRQIDSDTLKYVQIHNDLFIKEYGFWDDDCGNKFWYNINRGGYDH